MATKERELQVGDVGTELTVVVYECINNVDVIVDISTETEKTITIQRPDSTLITRTAEFTIGGVDGSLYIVTTPTDLTLAGTYYIQAYVSMPTWTGNSDIGEFEVHTNLV
jgi:hypothetical protein